MARLTFEISYKCQKLLNKTKNICISPKYIKVLKRGMMNFQGVSDSKMYSKEKTEELDPIKNNEDRQNRKKDIRIVMLFFRTNLLKSIILNLNDESGGNENNRFEDTIKYICIVAKRFYINKINLFIFSVTRICLKSFK